MKNLRGKRALVTGAASGIGRCTALALAREGVTLFLTDRDETGLDAVSREAGAEGVVVETALCDLTDRAAISAMLSRVTERPLNIVVNCAGVALYGSLHLMTPDEVQRLLAVNLLAPVQIVTELLDHLLGVEDAHIVNVSSFLGLAPISHHANAQPALQGSNRGDPARVPPEGPHRARPRPVGNLEVELRSDRGTRGV